MIGFLYHWFDWPNGGVLQNLIAWIIGLLMGASVPVWKLFKKLDRMHEHISLIHAHQLLHTPARQTRKA